MNFLGLIFSIFFLATMRNFGVGANGLFNLSTAGSGGEATVRGTCYLYYPERISWNLRTANTFCTTWDEAKPLEWRSRYGWVSFCGPVGPTGQASCGRCLHLTNVETGAVTMARIIDQCTNGGLDIDIHVFKKLDTNGNGWNRGHLTVKYKFMDSC